ncbi:MAG: hypothetical protein PHP10_00355 [Candidatus Omnitrophica bacterium]|nr:hypothetical protein [Candidatus Omnitrophota bacterium]
MIKKSFLLVILFAFVSLSGCCTVAKGTAGTAVGAAGGFAQGVKEGAKDDYNAIQKADAWVKENLW